MIELDAVHLAVATDGGLLSTGQAFVLPLAWLLLALTALAAVGGWRLNARRSAEYRREGKVMRECFGKFLPECVADAIIDNNGELALERRVATVLFSDIDGFTALAENMQPTELFDMLNAYFGAITEVISRHGGVINQFQGDAVLATFNIPLENSHHAANAVRAALDIQAIVATRTFAGVSLRTRIGLNTGDVVAGSVGGRGRLSYTVHGDAVNLAARFEQLNKDLGTRILASEQTVHAAGTGFAFQALGSVPVRGKQAPVSLFRLTPPAISNLDSRNCQPIAGTWNLQPVIEHGVYGNELSRLPLRSSTLLMSN